MNWLWWVPDWLAWRIMDAAALHDGPRERRTEQRTLPIMVAIGQLCRANMGVPSFLYEAYERGYRTCTGHLWDGWQPGRYM